MTEVRNSRQHDAARIFQAQRAAGRLLKRTTDERQSVMGMSRDELSALAQQLMAIASIAERYHLERATAGSLPVDAFPEPVE